MNNLEARTGIEPVETALQAVSPYQNQALRENLTLRLMSKLNPSG
jgi:hypothetical protein